MKNEEIYKLIERQEDNVKELFSIHNTALRAKIEAENSIVLMKIDTLTDYQKIQNGRTDKIEEDVKGLAKDTRVWRLIHRNPKAAGVVIGLALLGLAALFILKNLIL